MAGSKGECKMTEFVAGVVIGNILALLIMLLVIPKIVSREWRKWRDNRESKR